MQSRALCNVPHNVSLLCHCTACAANVKLLEAATNVACIIMASYRPHFRKAPQQLKLWHHILLCRGNRALCATGLTSLCFMQRVPEVGALPPVTPAPLVQPQALPPDLEAVDPRWFQYLRNSSGPSGLVGLIRGILS